MQFGKFFGRFLTKFKQINPEIFKTLNRKNKKICKHSNQIEYESDKTSGERNIQETLISLKFNFDKE